MPTVTISLEDKWALLHLLTCVSLSSTIQKSRMIISSVRIGLCSFSPWFAYWLKHRTTCMLFQPFFFQLATLVIKSGERKNNVAQNRFGEANPRYIHYY